jgi:hypothetical protein
VEVFGIDIETDAGGRWRLYPIGDPHIDEAKCNRKRLGQYLRLIASDPHGIWVCVGDWISGTTPTHKFFEFGSFDPGIIMRGDDYIAACMLEVERTFEPLKDRPGVCLQGNHDLRFGGTKWSGFGWEIARRLGATYARDECLFKVGANSRGTTSSKGRRYYWTVHAHHGAGGGYKPGGKVNRYQDTTAARIDADIHIRGHVHDSDARILPIRTLTKRKPWKLLKRPKAWVTAPSFVEHISEGVHDYSSRSAFPVADEGIIYLEIANPTMGKDRDWSGRIIRKECEF